jgi:hypothetical protein
VIFFLHDYMIVTSVRLLPEPGPLENAIGRLQTRIRKSVIRPMSVKPQSRCAYLTILGLQRKILSWRCSKEGGMLSHTKHYYDRFSLCARIAGMIAFVSICLSIWPAAAASLPGKKRLDWLEAILKEYSEAAHSMCQGGEFLGCEVADGALGALQTLKGARRECSDGNQTSCDQVAHMAPQIAAQTTDVCLQFKLKDCPKQPALVSDSESETAPPPAGYFDYQGEQLPGYVPSTQGPPPGVR